MIGKIKTFRSTSRRTAKPSIRRRPCVPCKTLPSTGPAREAIEMGRNRLLITGAMLFAAFGCIGLRLVDLTMLQPAEEPPASQPHRSMRTRAG
jgi:hypothetical protein